MLDAFEADRQQRRAAKPYFGHARRQSLDARDNAAFKVAAIYHDLRIIIDP
ncbi:hypothetical protein [Sphingomonas sp. TDK1]|uniref:hypothetical protein n=1 Tax=Sphingomonas sp. TDK1 TaxID=453247 RepID=UPI000AE24A9B|nr:hypothetical protein [Sphingomonas sp. TDK1]